MKASDRPTEMLLSDLDGDGNPDLALANHDSYSVTLLLGDGKGGFVPSPRSPAIMKDGHYPHTHGLLAGDLNGDERPDLVSFNSDDDDVSVALNDGEGGFTSDSSFPVGPSPYPGALGDLDGDGHLDIVAPSTVNRAPGQGGSAGLLTVLFGDGHGGFRAGAVPLRTISPGYVVAADVNGDRMQDLAASHLERSELTILIGDGKGGFAETSGSPYYLGHTAWHVAVADLNGDGKVDVAAAAGDGVRVMLGDGRGGFSAAPGSPFATGNGAWQLAVGDVNGDGEPDVVTSDFEDNTVTVLLAQ